MIKRLKCLIGMWLVCSVSGPLFAQTPRDARATVTVVDPSGAVVAGATISVVGLEAATKVAEALVAKTADTGIAIVTGLAPGRYTISAEFPGFEVGLLRDIRLRSGDNRHVVVLPIAKIEESVSVGADGQAAASTRANVAFGSSLSTDQINALSDDPTEALQQLNDLAGSGAIVRIDSFEGQQLPSKSQIKSIHVTRDQFAAETEQPGSTFVDVITQPGVGPVRGTGTFSFRDGGLSAPSPFTGTKGPEQIHVYSANIGGAIIKNKSNFSLSINGRNEFNTPVLNAALPDGTQSEDLNLQQPHTLKVINGLLDYALTKDQTLRFGYSQNDEHYGNLGVGGFDLPERAFSIDQRTNTFRALEAGPIGRRAFINTRLTATWRDSESASAVNAPTVVVQDSFNSGGAQQAGGTRSRDVTLASDLDYVRGINSWRAGVMLYGDWYNSNSVNNALGTYVFSNLAAYEAGQPILYTRQIGDPSISFFNARGGIYLQDDLRVRKGLTLSPGLRYSVQTDVHDYNAFEPRFGMTWAPFKSGKTTFRASAGIFHGWMPSFVQQQTLLFNGVRQSELVVTNPPYPDPGSTGIVPPTNEYQLGNYQLNKNIRYSGGFDQRFSPRFGVNVLFNYYHQEQLPRGVNLNPLVNGVRPDPTIANVIQTITDAEIIRHELYINFNLSLYTPGPAANGPRFNWRRLTLNGGYSYIYARRDAFGPFDAPPSGNLADDWGYGPADNPYRVNLQLTSTQLKNFTANFTLLASDGFPYNETTGLDNNGDGIVNDRPAGVGIWTLRTAAQATINARFTYTVPLDKSPRPDEPARYRIGVYVNVINLTDHANYGGYSGVQTSPFFERPTLVVNPRKVDVGMNISF